MCVIFLSPLLNKDGKLNRWGTTNCTPPHLQYINSAFTISSATFLAWFIFWTQAIWSLAFNSSSTFQNRSKYSISDCKRACACVSILSRYSHSVFRSKRSLYSTGLFSRIYRRCLLPHVPMDASDCSGRTISRIRYRRFDDRCRRTAHRLISLKILPSVLCFQGFATSGQIGTKLRNGQTSPAVIIELPKEAFKDAAGMPVFVPKQGSWPLNQIG